MDNILNDAIAHFVILEDIPRLGDVVECIGSIIFVFDEYIGNGLSGGKRG